MRKSGVLTLFVLLMLVFVSTQNLAAAGLGSSRIGLGLGTPNAVLIYRPTPFDLRLGYDFTEGSQFIFISGDWRPAGYIPISGPLYCYFGLGAYAKFYPESSADDVVEWGTRLPVGISLLFLDNIAELFVEVAPGFDLYPKPAFSDDPVQFWVGLSFAIQ
ncbi:hypothetical protein [Sediminispirochaeta bajacaliforniensis]|uniref:hypothetical protein n=1 Tax=Sediminispirochaeta bajacaliforniensis TaxID=148 RepID=UPI00036E06D4|nr:hypothetical protein [Sediminispirochaeta bajacaliforniensis]